MESGQPGPDEKEWEAARRRLFPGVPRPDRARTEVFVQRLMERLPEPARPWARWLFPALAFSAAAFALSLWLPERDEAAERALTASSSSLAAWSAQAPSAADLLDLSGEAR